MRSPRRVAADAAPSRPARAQARAPSRTHPQRHRSVRSWQKGRTRDRAASDELVRSRCHTHDVYGSRLQRDAGGVGERSRADGIGTVERLGGGERPARSRCGVLERPFTGQHEVGQLAELLHELVPLVLEQITASAGQIEMKRTGPVRVAGSEAATPLLTGMRPEVTSWESDLQGFRGTGGCRPPA